MINKPLDAVDLEDLRALVRAQATESRNLEFKMALPPLGSEAATKEFLADVTSLANAHGSDLLFGISEKAGVASDIPGVNSADPDRDILRLESMVRDGVQPRIAGLRTRWIETAPGVGVIAMRVPASLTAPHRIIFKCNNRFYTRTSRGKHEMDTHELRVAFNAAEQLPERFRSLHKTAVAGARGVDMPFDVCHAPLAVASIAPLAMFRDVHDFDITPGQSIMPPGRPQSSSYRYTLEGILWDTVGAPENGEFGYALTHRRGYVDAGWTFGGAGKSNGKMLHIVWPEEFENGLLKAASATASMLSVYGIEGPWVLLTTLLNIKGYSALESYDRLSEPSYRKDGSLPEIVADRLDAASLLPVFQAFWRVFGGVRPL